MNCIRLNKHTVCITYSKFNTSSFENSVDPDRLASNEARKKRNQIKDLIVKIMSRTNFGIQTNSVDPDLTAPRSLIWVHTFCYTEAV